ncbi:MAG: integrase family protein [Proteobacteria bacterium]|nr:integrase family protein [Pseudomonadota bacterium]
MRLTKSIVDRIEPPTERDQAFYRDAQLKGFAVRVTASGVKSFIVEKLVGGKVRGMTIGRYGELTVEQARREAQKLLGKIATSIDPRAEKQTIELHATTLDQAFQDYLKARKALKPRTLYDYRRIMECVFSEWNNKPLLAITKDKVAKLHTQLGEERGQACANLTMRLLRALFNFAAGQYEDAQGRSLITDNPVRRLSQTRSWYRVERRQTYIKTHELAAWYQGVNQLENATLQDYLLLSLFTGLRRNEAATLKWSNIDFKSKTLTILNTKNHQPHTLPLSDYLDALLTRRQQQANSEYVFPGTGQGGYIVEPCKQMAKVSQVSGVIFTMHDLRRTFITLAESLDISAYAVKRLINHKMNNDVTAGYIVSDVERLRKPMQSITDNLLNFMTVQSCPVLEAVSCI